MEGDSDDDKPFTKGMFKIFLENLNKRFDTIDNRFDTIDKKFDAIDKKFDAIDKKFDAIDKKFDAIDKKLGNLQGFQDNEANAIEGELQMILRKYLIKEHPLMSITDFKIKTISDPVTHQSITNLDAAFLLKPSEYRPDYRRLYEAGISKIMTKQSESILSNIFVMAEAKHYIYRDKIKYKINQFEKIRNFFSLAKKVVEMIPKMAPQQIMEQLHVTRQFIETATRNRDFAKVDTFYLFFGAAYWQSGLLLEFQSAIEKYSKLSDEFITISHNKKIYLYNKMRALEKSWCSEEYYEQTMLTPEIVNKLPEYRGILYYVKLIEPSGDRYKIMKKDEPVGISNIILHGGGNTRKNKKQTKIHENKV
jgi:hypothetical protein